MQRNGAQCHACLPLASPDVALAGQVAHQAQVLLVQTDGVMLASGSSRNM